MHRLVFQVIRPIAVAAIATATLLSAAEVTTADKARYSLFHRTPEDMLRELSTDRPDLTESPYTVDAGWWQIESDLFSYTRNHDTENGNDVKTRGVSFGHINLKAGLTNRIDLQTVIETFSSLRTDDRVAGTREKISGFGDITSRLKINLWGNDGGETALAVMPFVKWPTNRHNLGNKYVEGGLIVPLGIELSHGWGMGLMTEVDVVRNGANDGYDAEWLNTVTFSHDIVGDLGGYLEFTHLLSKGGNQATFDCGLTYGVTRHLQLDVGINFGLTRATDKMTAFFGVSRRF